MKSAPFRRIRSVCPVCLKNLPAFLVRETDGSVSLEKNCPDHGQFSVPVWRGRMDFERWTLGASELPGHAGKNCPEHCGICAEHESGTCCALLEITHRCNLHCRFCFADGGSPEEEADPEELRAAIREIGRRCGGPLLQFSGGEPTLRDDLPELVRYAKEAGCRYTQLNTNGIRLAEEPAYAERLAEAGLDIVFLQFDGTRNEIYQTLRGADLLETKLKAIQICSELRIGVTLVPTVVPGVNDGNLGDLVSLACSLSPGVRGIHFQPVSWFGRYPGLPNGDERYTLDQLMDDLSRQAEIPIDCFMPSRCDHPLCGFHANLLIRADGSLRPLTSICHSSPARGSAEENRSYVARHWRRAEPEPEPRAGTAVSDEMDFDTFLYMVRNRSLSLSAMAFQDAMNLNLERLHRCTLHVYDRGRILPFCARYLSPMRVEDKDR